MAENKIFPNFLRCIEVNSKFNSKYGLNYYEPHAYSRLCNYLSEMRKNKELNFYEIGTISNIIKHNYSNYYKIKSLESLEPRNIAQKFIGRKKIRSFILNRDGNKCLKCSSEIKLQLDHIIPISKGGENKISNLQTLCNSCNSIKRDNYADYRAGSKQINIKKNG